MKKSVSFLAAIVVAATPAMAQVRPEECRPVFPLNDPVQASLPQDVVAERAIPTAAARRSFFGLPLLPLLLAGGGLAAIIGSGGGDNDDDTPVSPA